MIQKNIVLIGMPGCGKTTIGKILSKAIGYKYADSDDILEKKSGRSIKEWFDISEDAFRECEEQTILYLSQQKKVVISTGGGVIKHKSNIDNLKKNGIIFFINRPLSNIAGDVDIKSRPLLRDGIDNLYTIYNERYDLYKKFCDYEIINDGTIDEAVKAIMYKLGDGTNET